MTHRLTPNVRMTMIIRAAIKTINENDIISFTNEQVVENCDTPTSVPTLLRYFPRRVDLIRSVSENNDMIKREAIARGLLT